ncbi:serine hydrolase domain-containing protein [Sphingoaurantiacus capsulatus]|uniref:Serine hydrolase domain-containing protein n=1 Tax=Sphingoaurantiacus capsulatus TaxID=1771310 RepID=A0ABV7X7S2_9SPHN
MSMISPFPIRRLAAAIALLLLAAPATAASLRADLAANIERQGLVGAAWSTLTPDGSIAADAAGLRDATTRAPMRADDRVQVGSIAKTLLATGILRLMSEGRLRLDTPVADLLPDVAIDNRWAATEPVRLRHLLDHSAGLDDARLWQVFSLKATPDTPLRIALPAKLTVRRRPGTTFSYSNTGYTLLGMVIEQVTGERYERWLDRRLLAPLGMADSRFAFTTQARDPRLAMGHFEAAAPHPAVAIYARPAAQLTTTAPDMMRFARFLMSNGRLAGRPFIDPALMRARGRPQGTDAARAGLRMGYALGLARQERGGAVGLCHGGDTVGFRAMLCVYPDQRAAFFRAVNADVEGADYRSIDASLVRALGLPATAPAAAAPMPAGVAAWAGIYVPSPARFESFAWLDETLGFLTLSRRGDRLELKPFMGAARRLVPVGSHLFRAEDRVAASHVLLVDRDGQRVIASDVQSFRRVALWRIGLRWLSLAAGVAGIAWILVAGAVRVARRRLPLSDPLFLPFLAVLALALPVPLFLTQSFIAMGDLTPASATLAAVTGLLPLAMVAGLAQRWRRGAGGQWLDTAAMAGVLQWAIGLMAWGLLPLRLWG